MSTTNRIINKSKKKVESFIETDNKLFAESLNVIAATKEGMYVLNKLMADCGQNRSSMDSKEDTEGTIQYREGRRSIWLMLQNNLNRKNLKETMFFDRRVLCRQQTEMTEEDLAL